MFNGPYNSRRAQWRSGNAGVCKTLTRGFDSPLRLMGLEYANCLAYVGNRKPEDVAEGNPEAGSRPDKVRVVTDSPLRLQARVVEWYTRTT